MGWQPKTKVKWTEIIEKIENSGLKKIYISSKLNISDAYLHQMIHGQKYLSDSIKGQLEVLLDCRFQRPTPEPEKDPT